MLTQARATGASRREPEPPLQRSGLNDALLDAIGDPADEHILVLGNDGPDLMCALVRAGAIEVIHLNSYERLHPDTVGIAVVPRLPSLNWLAAALPAIRRALFPTGRLVLYSETAGEVATANRIRSMLLRHGYCKIRCTMETKDPPRGGAWLVTTAEVPAFDLRKAA